MASVVFPPFSSTSLWDSLFYKLYRNIMVMILFLKTIGMQGFGFDGLILILFAELVGFCMFLQLFKAFSDKKTSDFHYLYFCCSFGPPLTLVRLGVAPRNLSRGTFGWRRTTVRSTCWFRGKSPLPRL